MFQIIQGINSINSYHLKEVINYKIFNGNEFSNKDGAQLQQAGIKLKQKFDYKRNFYHQLKNQLIFSEHGDPLNDKLTEFDETKYSPWNQKWNDIHRSNDIDKLTQFFVDGKIFFDEMDKYMSTISLPQYNSEEIDSLKTDILKRVEGDILALKADISLQIDNGINDLIGLKAEMSLEKSFKDNIEGELTKSKDYRFAFLISFIISLILIPCFLSITFISKISNSLSYYEIITLRVAMAFAMSILSYFLYSQYKVYQLITLRYSHLHGFLGGGATFINQIISGNEQTKAGVNKKMAELFMELDDVFNLVKKHKHPTEASIDKTGEVVDKISTLAASLRNK